MLVWLPSGELQDAVGEHDKVEIEVVRDWEPRSLPSSKDVVEVVVPPQAFGGDFREIAAELPRLRVVQTLSTGVEAFANALPDGVRLYNASGVHVSATAEWVVAAILACERELFEFDASRRARAWAPRTTRGLSGSQVLILGAGEIGRAVASRLAPFGAHVTLVARRQRAGVASASEASGLLPKADVVVVLLPHTPETESLVDRAFLSRMKDGGLLVNASRGAIVESDALLAEVTSGRLRAALDVFSPEPPERSSQIWSAPGVFLTPHAASNVAGMVGRQAALLAERLPAFARQADVAGMRDQGY